jgi:hypothetical protein
MRRPRACVGKKKGNLGRLVTLWAISCKSCVMIPPLQSAVPPSYIGKGCTVFGNTENDSRIQKDHVTTQYIYSNTYLTRPHVYLFSSITSLILAGPHLMYVTDAYLRDWPIPCISIMKIWELGLLLAWHVDILP